MSEVERMRTKATLGERGRAINHERMRVLVEYHSIMTVLVARESVLLVCVRMNVHYTSTGVGIKEYFQCTLYCKDSYNAD